MFGPSLAMRFIGNAVAIFPSMPLTGASKLDPAWVQFVTVRGLSEIARRFAARLKVADVDPYRHE